MVVSGEEKTGSCLTDNNVLVTQDRLCCRAIRYKCDTYSWQYYIVYLNICWEWFHIKFSYHNVNYTCVFICDYKLAIKDNYIDLFIREFVFLLSSCFVIYSPTYHL